MLYIMHPRLISSEDKLCSHHFYVEVAKKAIEVSGEQEGGYEGGSFRQLNWWFLFQVYLFLHDHPEAKEGTMNGPMTIASMCNS